MKPHILVVDDEGQVRDLLVMYFRKHGYEASSASTSSETLRAVGAKQPDLVVLDIGLDQEDGMKLLETLKRSFSRIKVVMLTGMGFMEELLQEAQQKGADGYVSKVLPLDELLATVEQVLRSVSAKSCA